MTGAEYDAATAQLAALQPGPAPHRPADALHPILRLRDMLAAAAAPPDPADDRVIASLDLGVQRMVAARMRDALVDWRKAGRAAGGGDRGAARRRRGAGGGRLRRLRRSARRRDRFQPRRRSPGSTLKPFLYAAALQHGLLHPADMLDDGPGQAGAIHNADARYLGPLPPSQALANSRNVPAAEVLRRLGLGAGFDLFHALGLQMLRRHAGQPGPGDGDRCHADQPGPAGGRLHDAGR